MIRIIKFIKVPKIKLMDCFPGLNFNKTANSKIKLKTYTLILNNKSQQRFSQLQHKMIQIITYTYILSRKMKIQTKFMIFNKNS